MKKEIACMYIVVCGAATVQRPRDKQIFESRF
jgi:hypothetical protein